MPSNSKFTRDDNGNIAVRVVSNTGVSEQPDSMFTTDADGNVAVRVVGIGGGGGGAVSSVNGKTGAVVLDAEDVGALPSDTHIPTDPVQADWDEADQEALDYIKNKPTIPTPTQYDTMPTATSGNLGDVVQYVGTTTQDYTNGYFYENIASYTDPTATISQTAGRTDSVSFETTVGSTEVTGTIDAVVTMFDALGQTPNEGTIRFEFLGGTDLNVWIIDGEYSSQMSGTIDAIEYYGFTVVGTPEAGDEVICTYSYANLHNVAIDTEAFISEEQPTEDETVTFEAVEVASAMDFTTVQGGTSMSAYSPALFASQIATYTPYHPDWDWTQGNLVYRSDYDIWELYDKDHTSGGPAAYITEIATNNLDSWGITLTGTPADGDIISYVYTEAGVYWEKDDEIVDVADYGITYNGSPVADDVLTVVYTAPVLTGYSWTQKDVQPAPAAPATGIDWKTTVDLPADFGMSWSTAPMYTIRGGLPDGEYEFYWQVACRGTDANAPLGYVTYNCRFKITDIGGVKYCYGMFAPVLDGNGNWLPSSQYIPNNQTFYDIMYVMNNGDYMMFSTNSPWTTDIAAHYPSLAVPECFKISAIKNLGTGVEYIATGELFNNVWPSFNYQMSGQIVSQRLAPDVYVPQYHILNSITYSDESQYLRLTPNRSIAHDSVGTDCSELDIAIESDEGKYHVIVENAYTTYVARVLEASGVFANAQVGWNNVGDTYVYLNTAAGTSGSAYVAVGTKGSSTGVSAWMSPTDTFTPAEILEVGATVTTQNLGKILQYTGTTNANYTNGYFYKATGTAVTVPANITISNMSPDDFTLGISDVSGFLSALSAAMGWNLNYLKQEFERGTTLAGYWDADNSTIITINLGFYGDITDPTVLSYVSVSTTGTYTGEVYFVSNAAYTPASTEIQNGSWVLIDVQDVMATLQSVTGYDATKTQTLKNVTGTITWVDD